MMKKSLIALAVLAGSGVASAQSTVTIYGLIDSYFGQTKGTGPGQTGVSQTVINSGGLQTSRFGLKGSEDLGGGMKVNFQLENGFNVDTGQTPNNGTTNSSIFSRQSWVGVSGGFGEVKIGKMWTPFDEVKGSGAAGFDANIFAPATNVWASNGYNDRPGNSLYYMTPSFGGFTAAVLYSFSENKTTARSAGRTTSFNIAYANGPIGAALSYQNEKADGNTAATKYTQLNGSYDFGVVKLLGAYGRVKNGTVLLNNSTASPQAAAATTDKTTEYQIGLDFPVTSSLTLSGGYARSKDTLPAAGGDVKRNGYGLAALYALSKRTNLYAGYQQAKQTQTAVGDIKIKTLAAGIRHTF